MTTGEKPRAGAMKAAEAIDTALSLQADTGLITIPELAKIIDRALLEVCCPGEAGEAMTPKRIQRKRTKGWKMPPNSVYVGRPTKWGNPYRPEATGSKTVWWAISQFQERAEKWRWHIQTELRGKDLACWCSLDQPCHADVLLEIANSKTEGESQGKP